MLLRQALNDPQAEFRPGQWECIEGVLRRRRQLVVQRTGWGKSMVYFLATALLRQQGAGVTLLISPLLALMRNQIQAAHRIGIVAESINSTNEAGWDAIENRLLRSEIDLLLISPERLANQRFRERVLSHIADAVGLFVVDEAHCISDWGHDFRPDYRRIVRVLQALPPNLPVLATTATANNRVVSDVAAQLGDVTVVRGPLVRESLKLQTIWLPTPQARMAWLAEVLPTLPGSGIIYTLTQRDAERLARWLRHKNIHCLAYHAGLDAREQIEDTLLRNEVKALVATVALGMGFDKPDIGFVIHYQRPGSVVHYYQQVGRAGRAVDDAYGILLSGDEDQEITDYFITSAFPPQQHVDHILTALQRADEGLSVPMLQRELNVGAAAIHKALKLLSVESPSPVIKEGSRWFRTATRYHPDQQRIEQLCQLRRDEQQQMLNYMRSSGCLMRFLSDALDDPHAADCGRCAACRGVPLLPDRASDAVINEAAVFLKRSHQAIAPRRQWPSAGAFEVYGWQGRIAAHLRAEEGRALALWGDPGWGELVRRGKYADGRFSDDLIEGCLDLIGNWQPQPSPTAVVCVPSRQHPELVPDFARRLAERLGLPYSAAVRKIRDNQPQKTMQNSFQQAHNVDGVFTIDVDMRGERVLLLDDMVDSRWTMTVVAALLREHGCDAVFPLALALNSLRG